jgi:predicted  nucleic acid-binding Zn-ribbon protein
VGPRVFVTYAREDGPDAAQRLVGVLERGLGPGALALASPGGEAAAVDREAIEHSDVVVALIGPGWRATDDQLAAELSDAFAHRVAVIAMLMWKSSLPARRALPPQLGPLLDNHPRLTLEMPSEFYWDVTTSHLARWLARILDENRALERHRAAAAEAVAKTARELRSTRARLGEAEAEARALEGRLATVGGALSEAAQTLEARRRDVGEGRTAPGLRVFLSYRAETGGDVRTLERDLRERLDGGRLSSSEPIPDTADPVAVAQQRIARADVVLAVIGPRWTGEKDGGGPRLDDGADPVRLELEAALARGLPVIPVLTQHAPMPAADGLPGTLRTLAAERPYELIVAFWNDGVTDLLERLDEIESKLRRREKALEDAVAHHRRLERDEAGVRSDQAKAEATIRTVRERVAALEEEERRAREEAERLRHEHRDANAAYQDGPGPITLEGRGSADRVSRDGAAGRPSLARAPSRRLLLGALGIIVVVLIIIAASH